MTARLVCTSVLVFCAIAACSSEDSVEGTGSSGGTRSSGGSSGSGGIVTTGGSSGTSSSTGGSATGGSATGGSATGGSATGGSSSGSGGTRSSGGSSGSGGTTAAGGTGGGSAADGGLPLGTLCANDSNCSQAQGAAVCCQSECTLAANCPAGTPYLPCNATGDCAVYGGGKICCEWGSGGTLMRFCTKQSGCSGKILP